MGDQSKDRVLESKLNQGAHGKPWRPPAAWLLIVIDTDAVMANYPDPSTNQHNPTPVAASTGFLVATGAKVESEKKPEEACIEAHVGDAVCVSAISGSDNFEGAVLLYGIERFSCDRALSDFGYHDIRKSTVAPNSTSEPLPARIEAHTFEFYQARVIAAGTEEYEARFALHIRDLGIGQHILCGYFSWNLQITVQN